MHGYKPGLAAAAHLLATLGAVEPVDRRLNALGDVQGGLGADVEVRAGLVVRGGGAAEAFKAWDARFLPAAERTVAVWKRARMRASVFCYRWAWAAARDGDWHQGEGIWSKPSTKDQQAHVCVRVCARACGRACVRACGLYAAALAQAHWWPTHPPPPRVHPPTHRLNSTGVSLML